MKKWMFVLFALFVCSVTLAGAGTAIEVRPVVEVPGANSVDMKAEDGVVLHVAKKALLTEKDFSDASVTPAGDHSMLNLTLRDAAAKQMRQFTAAHVGKKLALVVNGELLGAPVVKVPIKDGKVVISFMPEDQALGLARSIHQSLSR